MSNAVLSRGRTPERPLWIGAAGVALIRLFSAALLYTSATVQGIYYSTPLYWTRFGWSSVAAVVGGCLAVFGICLAIAWLPQRPRADVSYSKGGLS